MNTEEARPNLSDVLNHRLFDASRDVTQEGVEAKTSEENNVSSLGNIEMISRDELTTIKELHDLFLRDKTVYKSIVNSMREHKFDVSKPITYWIMPNGDKVVVDGNTRFDAAGEAGLSEVAAVKRDFTSLDDAIEFARAEQFERRNLDTKGKLSYLLTIGYESLEGNKNEAVQSLVGVSSSQAKKYIKIMQFMASNPKRCTNLVKKFKEEDSSLSFTKLAELCDTKKNTRKFPAKLPTSQSPQVSDDHDLSDKPVVSCNPQPSVENSSPVIAIEITSIKELISQYENNGHTSIPISVISRHSTSLPTT